MTSSIVLSKSKNLRIPLGGTDCIRREMNLLGSDAVSVSMSLPVSPRRLRLLSQKSRPWGRPLEVDWLWSIDRHPGYPRARAAAAVAMGAVKVAAKVIVT